jgi:hypothetical protein
MGSDRDPTDPRLGGDRPPGAAVTLARPRPVLRMVTPVVQRAVEEDSSRGGYLFLVAEQNGP